MLAETGDGSGTTQLNGSPSQLALDDRFVIIATNPAQQPPRARIENSGRVKMSVVYQCSALCPLNKMPTATRALPQPTGRR
jgi:hypothetical protein